MMTVFHLSPDVVRAKSNEAKHRLLPGIEETAGLFASLNITGIANEWLLKMEWKQVLAVLMLGDLLDERRGKMKMLEVGGGLSYLSLELAKTYSYTLIEKANHEPAEHYRLAESLVGKPFAFLGDWSDYSIEEEQDLVLAIDLFPNVDQRLYDFVEKFLPMTKEMRLAITYYEDTSFEVQRILSGERLIIRPWGIKEVRAFMDYLTSRFPQWCPSYDVSQVVYVDYAGSLFGNKRNVLYCDICKG